MIYTVTLIVSSSQEPCNDNEKQKKFFLLKKQDVAYQLY